jgi:hypothetical protein
MELHRTISEGSYLLMFVVAVEVALILGVVLFKMMSDRIDLTFLLSEPGGDRKASLSRFQFFVFTFVIAGLYLLLSIESGQFVEVPNSVLMLLGISGGSYLVSKGIPGPDAGRITMREMVSVKTKTPAQVSE